MDLALTLLQTGKDFDRAAGLDGVSGPSRYFLCRLLCDEETLGPHTSVASYVKKYGVNDRVVSRAVRELVDCGVAEKTATQDDKGVPRWELRLRADLRELLAEAGQTEPVEAIASLALHVLTSDGREAGVESKRRLTPYNRMVLAALLVRADEAGAVYGVGASDLKRVAGLSGDGLVSQLSKLQNLGYLRTRVGGVTGRYLFGRSAGAYFVNVGHPDFHGIAGHSYVLVRRETWVAKGKLQPAMALYLDAHTVQQARLRESQSDRPRVSVFAAGPGGDELERDMAYRWKTEPVSCNGYPLHYFFKDRPASQFAGYLQMLICRYASLIINTCLREGYCDSQSREGFLQTQMMRDLGLGSEPEGTLEPAIKAITCASILKAVKAWSAICHDEVSWALSKSGLACVILPSLEMNNFDLDTVVVLYALGMPEHWRGRCSLMPTKFYSSANWNSFSYGAVQDLGDERHLNDEKALRWGLRSMGKRYPQKVV